MRLMYLTSLSIIPLARASVPASFCLKAFAASGEVGEAGSIETAASSCIGTLLAIHLS